MARFQITGPDGNTYEITAPEGASEDEVMAFVQSQVAGQQQPAPEAPDAREPIGTGRGLARAAFQGLTFGTGDELAAAVGATLDRGSEQPWGDRYGERLSSEREALSQFREEQPWLAYPAEIAGAVPTAVAMPGAMVGRGMSLGARMLAGLGIGAGQGAAYGFAAGEDGPEQRATSAGIGGAMGGTIGAAAPAVGQGLRSAAGHLASRSAARNIGTTRPAFEALRRTLDPDAAARIRAAGPDAMLADAGPSMRTVLDTTVQRSGPAGTVAREAVERRAAAAGQQTRAALDRSLGRPEGVRSVERGLRQGTAAARGSAYDSAYRQPIDYSGQTGQQIERIVRERVPASAINRANALMRAEGERSRQILFRMADDGTVQFERLPDVRQIDYITRGLNEVAERADGAGRLGGQTQTGRVYQNLSRDLRGLTREAVPEYATALDTAAEPLAARQALQFGNRMLSRSVTRDEVAETVGRMSRAERSMAAQGVRSQIDEAMANVRRAMTDTNMDAREAVTAMRDLSSRANREKMRALLGREEADALYRTLDQASSALDLRAGVASGSRTFARTATDETIRGQRGGVVDMALEGRPLAAGRAAWQGVTGRTPAAQARMDDATYQELARLLTGPRGPEAVTLAERLMQSPMPGQQGEQLGRLAEMLLRRNAPVTAPLAQGR